MSDPHRENPEQEPKLVVDTDWKEQVAKEKAAAQSDEPERDDGVTGSHDDTEQPIAASTDRAASSAPADADAAEPPTPPPASFEMLVSMLFTQAMAALGQIPDPATGKPSINKAYAKHYIDTLDMLCDKTKGNLNDNESKMIDEALHALRMTYVNTKQPS